MRLPGAYVVPPANLYNRAVRSPGHRRAYIDVARGIAVLLMIEAHTTDAWTSASAKATTAFRNAAIVGGFAAPLFLWLAGLAVVLAQTRIANRSGSRADAIAAGCRRGLEILLLSFLFRLQAFVVSPGGDPLMLLRVDILNIMGPAIVAASLMWGLRPSMSVSGRVATYVAATVFVAMSTPIVRASHLVEGLPTLLQWYVRPAGEYTTFTLLPWTGFVFAGAAAGTLVAAVKDERSEGRLQVALAICGVALIAAGVAAAARPSIYRAASFWTSSPAWFAIRVGVLMVLLPLLFALASRGGMSVRPLERLGRHSLFIYWIHVELVYGYAAWPLWHRLPLRATAIAYIVFCLLMYATLGLRDRAVLWWQQRGAVRASSGHRPLAGVESPPHLSVRRLP